MRNRMIAGNWKMNETYTEGVVLAQGLAKELADGTGDVDVVVCPPAVDLKGVAEVIEQENAPFALGAQNVYWEPKGAFTGEISIAMIKNIGCAFCIVGHSERRNLFGETNEEVNLKARALIEADITPIICVGETLEQTIEREVMEEVGLRVRNIRYYKSQPWSFSDSLLMGFFAVVDGDSTARPDHVELSVARWVARRDLPREHEDTSSLTNEMIELFARGEEPMPNR